MGHRGFSHYLDVFLRMKVIFVCLECELTSWCCFETNSKYVLSLTYVLLLDQPLAYSTLPTRPSNQDIGKCSYTVALVHLAVYCTVC